MDKNLVIYDEYITGVGSNCVRRGSVMEAALKQYINILGQIRQEAIVGGEIAAALSQFINCAKLLQGEIETISDNMDRICDCMIERIDEEDQFLF